MARPARRLTVATALVLAAAAACSHQPPLYETVAARGDRVEIELDRVDDGQVHFFTFPHEGHRVNFLIRSDGAGVLHSHLDACYSCYRYRRGFVVEDRALVCIACRLAYPLADEVWDFIGACAPIEIHSEIDGDHLVITRSRLERASRYF